MEDQHQHSEKHDIDTKINQADIHQPSHEDYKGHSGQPTQKDQPHHDHHAMMITDFKKRFWTSLVITIPILMLSPMIQNVLGIRELFQFNGENYVLLILSSFVFFFGGLPFLKGIYEELKKLQPGMMTLIALAITVAYVYSSFVALGFKGEIFFWELATLIDIMLLGHWIEMRSVMSASRALEELAKLLPNVAHKISGNGDNVDVELSQIAVNDKILIKPGEKIPSDGEIVEGKSSVNESMLTGESKPVSKKVGDKIIAGAINGEGSLTVQIKQVGKETFLSKVIELVKQAQESKSKTQDLADRAALILTILAIISGLATFFIWTLLTTQNFAFAIERTVTVMVITCPHALGLAVPLVVAVSTGLAAKSGFLIRNRSAFENARNITAIVFDKTGTLTEGIFGVTDVLIFDSNNNKEEILKYAAALENNSQHPIAKGIIEAAHDSYKVDDFESITGMGVKGKVNNKNVLVVSPGYLNEKKIVYDQNAVTALQMKGNTVVILIIDDKVIGAIGLGDKIRTESKSAIQRLQKMGIKCLMLTGDNKQTAEYVAKELGLDEFFAEVMPDQKSSKVKEIQQRGLIVAMTGDGVNDAPALAQADIGIAIGAGSDVAVETADIILIKNNPDDVASVIALAKTTYKKMIQNLWWATGYNVIAIPLAAGVLFYYGILLSPAIGAAFMSLSTVIVSINAKLLKA
jgi:Cu2+-exporting ATPase